MGSPTHRKTAPVAPPPAESPELLPILVARKVLTPEQADRAKRSARMSNVTTEQAVVQLGMASEIQIAQALAAHTGLAYVKINPLDLDLRITVPEPYVQRERCRRRRQRVSEFRTQHVADVEADVEPLAQAISLA
jgi:hypothetical protein